MNNFDPAELIGESITCPQCNTDRPTKFSEKTWRCSKCGHTFDRVQEGMYSVEFIIPSLDDKPRIYRTRAGDSQKAVNAFKTWAAFQPSFSDYKIGDVKLLHEGEGTPGFDVPDNERWLFTAGELQDPHGCTRGDVFVIPLDILIPDPGKADEAARNGAISVQVDRRGNCNNCWSDGIAGVPEELIAACEASEDPSYFMSAATHEPAEGWRDVQVNEDGSWAGWAEGEEENAEEYDETECAECGRTGGKHFHNCARVESVQDSTPMPPAPVHESDTTCSHCGKPIFVHRDQWRHRDDAGGSPLFCGSPEKTVATPRDPWAMSGYHERNQPMGESKDTARRLLEGEPPAPAGGFGDGIRRGPTARGTPNLWTHEGEDEPWTTEISSLAMDGVIGNSVECPACKKQVTGLKVDYVGQGEDREIGAWIGNCGCGAELKIFND